MNIKKSKVLRGLKNTIYIFTYIIILTGCLELDLSKKDLSKFDKKLMETQIIKPGLYKAQSSENKPERYNLISAGNQFSDVEEGGNEKLKFVPLARYGKDNFIGMVNSVSKANEPVSLFSAVKVSKNFNTFTAMEDVSIENFSDYFQSKYGITIANKKISGNITPETLVALFKDPKFVSSVKTHDIKFSAICEYDPLDSNELKEVEALSSRTMERIKNRTSLDPEDFEKLLIYSNKCNEEAAFILARIYNEGIGVDKDLNKALDQSHISFSYGKDVSATIVGYIYYHNYQEYKKASNWYRKAADQGYAEAQYSLGVMYENGYGVKQDYTEAVKWYRKGANQGNASAQNKLGMMYDNGYGVRQNYTEAVKWYLKAANQGYGSAQYNLGAMYADGVGVKQNFTEAVKWFRKAANQGNASAQYSLGLMYANGYGVKKDDAEAVKWYLKAANQGYGSAQYSLGVMYADGVGVKQDYTEAAKWFRKAADQGDAPAQYYLGLMYANGVGVKQDYAEAAKWFRKAAVQGNEKAKEELGKLSR